jgi:hypothetical protein
MYGYLVLYQDVYSKHDAHLTHKRFALRTNVHAMQPRYFGFEARLLRIPKYRGPIKH